MSCMTSKPWEDSSFVAPVLAAITTCLINSDNNELKHISDTKPCLHHPTYDMSSPGFLYDDSSFILTQQNIPFFRRWFQRSLSLRSKLDGRFCWIWLILPPALDILSAKVTEAVKEYKIWVSWKNVINSSKQNDTYRYMYLGCRVWSSLA